MIQTDLPASQGLRWRPITSTPTPRFLAISRNDLGKSRTCERERVSRGPGKDSVEKRNVDVRLQLCHG